MYQLLPLVATALLWLYYVSSQNYKLWAEGHSLQIETIELPRPDCAVIFETKYNRFRHCVSVNDTFQNSQAGDINTQ